MPLKNIWAHMCYQKPADNLEHQRENYTLFWRDVSGIRPYLVHIVAVEAVPSVAVRTRSTLDALGRFYAHVLTEADARHASRLHHLGASQTFRKTERRLILRF